MTTESRDPLSPSEGAAPATEAEALFHRRLLDGGGVDGDELEALCSSHPVLAAELRSLAAHHRRGRELFGSGPGVAVPDEEQDERRSRYVVGREIARGGMGRILEVWDSELRRALAMKIPHAGVDTEPPGDLHQKLSHSRLINEAQILAQLDHPGVVPVHEVGRDAEGRPYFTMQLVRGRTLREVLDEEPGGSAAWTPTRVVTVMMRVCQAVAYAHSRGVIHRDLKPSNVMTGSFGEVYVMDWGLARARHRAAEDDVRTRTPSMGQAESGESGGSTQYVSVRTDRREHSAKDPSSPLCTLRGDVLGTPSYMSPEQAEGRVEDVDERSDVYGAGAMLYHLLTRRAPYTRADTDSTPLEILERVLKESPEDMEHVAPHVSRELAAVCKKAMARDPARRYAGMAELADDLGAYLEGRVVRAYRTGPLIELWKWTRRHRAAALVAGVIVLALVLGGIQELRSSRRQRRLNVELTASLYVNHMQLAAGALSRDDTLALRNHLGRAPAALRGWEWNLLSRQADTSERTVAVRGGRMDGWIGVPRRRFPGCGGSHRGPSPPRAHRLPPRWRAPHHGDPRRTARALVLA